MAAEDEWLIGPAAGLGDEQSRMNRSTRGQWDWYAAHRQAIERLILPEGQGGRGGQGGRICVLGAGNCNDLDLKWLTAAYAEVHLVDIDGAALERAAERQGVAGVPAIHVHAPVDLTGMAAITQRWVGRAAREDDIAAAVAHAEQDGEPIGGGGFDVVLSPCVLSQLLMGVRERVGKNHPGWPRLKSAIIGRHLSTIVRLTGPGGRGVFIVDLASSRVVPGLDRAAGAEVGDVLRMCVRDRRCFHGLEPAELGAVLRRQGGGGQTVSAPWVWHLGFGKAFLCYGLTVRPSR